MNRCKAILSALLLTFSNQVMAASNHSDAEPVRVMVLGVYHFGNPGLDVNNVEADDVRSPDRQRELDALAEALTRFAPTAVAHEGKGVAPYLDTRYADFTRRDLTRDRNEIVQIAYRLAAQAKLRRVYAIDEQPDDGEPDYFPFEKLQQFAEQSGKAGELREAVDASALMRMVEKAQTTLSIPEVLLLMNGEPFDDTFYWRVLSFGAGEDQPGPELAAYWFMRNAKIFNKLIQITQPGDRVIVIYGAGHGHWLREMIEKTPGYELEPVTPYLRTAAKSLLPAE